MKSHMIIFVVIMVTGALQVSVLVNLVELMFILVLCVSLLMALNSLVNLGPIWWLQGNLLLV